MSTDNEKLIAELREGATLAYGTDVAASVLTDAADALELAELRIEVLRKTNRRMAELAERRRIAIQSAIQNRLVTEARELNAAHEAKLDEARYRSEHGI